MLRGSCASCLGGGLEKRRPPRILERRVYSPGVFSRRTARAGGENSIARLMAEARARGDDFCDLTLSNPTSAGIEYPQDLWPLLERAQRAAQVYRPETLGLLSARQAVADYLGRSRRRPAAAEDILLSASTS